MSPYDIRDPSAQRAYMMANEAIVRACLESDVKVFASYPGSPTTEILDTFERICNDMDVRMDISANEKVALETAVGAAMVGCRSFCSMKSVGMNVASDALYVMAYTGVRSGCVVLLADDPHAHSSQSEQDGRWYGYNSYLPMLDPSDPQEAYEMVKFAYALSERYGTIVLLRTTTRINHQSAVVGTSEMRWTSFSKVNWKDNRRNYSAVGELARKGKMRLLETIGRIADDTRMTSFNRIEHFDGYALKKGGPGRSDGYTFGIATSGISYQYVLEALMRLKIKARILKIGMINPMPVALISGFLEGIDDLIVVEELSPYLETFIASAAQGSFSGLRIYGKRTGHLSEFSELDVPLVQRAIANVTGAEIPFDHLEHLKSMGSIADGIPMRPPVFCAGCPHRGTFTALRMALGDKGKVYLSNDIGCYTMLVLPPFSWSDSQLCMGSSLGIAAGVDLAAEEDVVSVIGDSTFFHAGLPGLVNAVHNGHDLTLLILDNSVTAMTGQQSHPGTEDAAGGRKGIKIDIEGALRGVGVSDITVIDPFQIRKSIGPMKEALKRSGVRAIISRGECALYHFRRYRRSGARTVPFFIDQEKCRKPYNCIKDFMCPAISLGPDRIPVISPHICVGCGECAQLCGFGSIRSTAVLKGGEDRVYYTPEDYGKLKEATTKSEEVER
ncbi:MAG: indolepyruvate ferredoxin oxidoreductase subunit alpha [Candidatus Thermoplasmatota archaeon]|nr:indolepyruvate ferredoxin oxidoreductase subunit alpha [Candidatus Thermoplasmatota archaeon]